MKVLVAVWLVYLLPVLRVVGRLKRHTATMGLTLRVSSLLTRLSQNRMLVLPILLMFLGMTCDYVTEKWHVPRLSLVNRVMLLWNWRQRLE